MMISRECQESQGETRRFFGVLAASMRKIAERAKCRRWGGPLRGPHQRYFHRRQRLRGARRVVAAGAVAAVPTVHHRSLAERKWAGQLRRSTVGRPPRFPVVVRTIVARIAASSSSRLWRDRWKPCRQLYGEIAAGILATGAAILSLSEQVKNRPVVSTSRRPIVERHESPEAKLTRARWTRKKKV